MAGKIHPGRLLYTLKVLLSPSGGIKSSFEVDRLVPLMEKFSRKLVSRIVYINILQASSPELLRMFLSRKGWNLVCLWFSGATRNNNVPLRIKLLNLLLLCPTPPETSSSSEMIDNIQQLTKNLKQIEMSVLALQVLSNWGLTRREEPEDDKTVTSLLQNLKTCVNEKMGAKLPQSPPSKTGIISINSTKVDIDMNVSRRSRSRSYVRVSVQVQMDSTLIEEKATKSYVASNTNLMTLKYEKCGSRTPNLPEEKSSSSKASNLVSMKINPKEHDANSNLVSKQKPFSIPRHSSSSKNSMKRVNIDFNENYPRKKLCFGAKEFEKSTTKIKVDGDVSKDSGKRSQGPIKNDIEEFKKRRKEEISRRHKKEAEISSKISFKSEYTRDFDQDSKKRVKDVVNALKKTASHPKEKKSVSKNVSPLGNKIPPTPEQSSSASKHKQDEKKDHPKPDDIESTKVPSIESLKSSTANNPNIIVGIRPLTPTESSNKENDKNKMETNETKSCHSSLKEVNLFGSDDLTNHPPRLKIKSKKLLSQKIPDSKRDQSPPKSDSTSISMKPKKRVSWASGENLVDIRYFDVVREERTNVCRQKFEERRKNEAKNEKLKLKGTQFQTSVVDIPAPLPPLTVGPSTSTLPPLPPKSFNRKSRSRRWPGLVRLEHRLKIRYGRKSEEKNIQKLREADTPSFHWSKLTLNEPSEIEISSQQRKSMVVSIRSILNDDISGEGTSIDFSLIEWPQQVLNGPNKGIRSLSKLSSVRSHSTKKSTKSQVQCIFWARGYCRNEQKCRFLHEPVEKDVLLTDANEIDNENPSEKDL